jgi:hypothetical protein
LPMGIYYPPPIHFMHEPNRDRRWLLRLLRRLRLLRLLRRLRVLNLCVSPHEGDTPIPPGVTIRFPNPITMPLPAYGVLLDNILSVLYAGLLLKSGNCCPGLPKGPPIDFG